MTEEESLKRVLQIESVLIELTVRTDWSSRVQADRIYDIAHGKSKEKIKKPWEHFAVGSLNENS